MLKAVLFDLDGTLLDIDLDAFLREYFSALGPALAEVPGGPDARDVVAAVMESTGVMCAAHPDLTNRAAFHAHFQRLTGVDLDERSVAERVDRFYRDQFPNLKRDHGPMPGNRRVVASARDAGLRTALATNPIFPRAAIDERMRWAGLEQGWFDVITSYETMSACKPDPAYFTDVAAALGVDPADCLMVGDDPQLDMPARAAGMKTFYVGAISDCAADWRGTLDDVSRLVESLTD